MARIFNIYFTYENVLHNAIVSVRPTPLQTEFTLNNFDEELLGLLPGNKILCKTPDEYFFQDASPTNSSDLMNAIIKAVVEHLHATEA
jgi:hypothetical protein